MYIVAIGWAFVVVLMAAAEATSSQGSLLGAFMTLVFYGVLPLGIVLYIMGTPARRRARRKAETASSPPNDSGMSSGDAIATERKEP